MNVKSLLHMILRSENGRDFLRRECDIFGVSMALVSIWLRSYLALCAVRAGMREGMHFVRINAAGVCPVVFRRVS